MKSCWGLLGVPILLLSVGCAPRLHDVREVPLEIGEIRTIAVPAKSQPQTVHLTASSPGAPISVHVYLPEHEEATERSITLGTPIENLLASGENSEQITLQATVPANKEALVRLQPTTRQAAKVHLTLKNCWYNVRGPGSRSCASRSGTRLSFTQRCGRFHP